MQFSSITTTSTAFLLFLFPLLAHAQFGQFFEQMFHGGGGGSRGDGGHHYNREPDVPSDASWYRKNYQTAPCSKYLCPNTLACVDKPTHCPCAFPEVEEKYEIDASGKVACLSKSIGGASADTPGVNVGWEMVKKRMIGGGLSDTARKVDLARKGLL